MKRVGFFYRVFYILTRNKDPTSSAAPGITVSGTSDDISIVFRHEGGIIESLSITPDNIQSE